MSERADLVLENGRVWRGVTERLRRCRAKPPETPTTSFPGPVRQRWEEVEGVAVAGERIVAVGDVEGLRGPETRVIDCGGRLVVPGFHDSHVHFAGGCLQLQRVDLRDAKDEAEFGRRLREFHARLPEGAWLVGGRWDHDLTFGGEFPTAAVLDRHVADRPVFVRRYDGHVAVANSLAMRIAGVTKETRDPDGGALHRDADGTPNGVLADPSPSRQSRRPLRGSRRLHTTHDQLPRTDLCARHLRRPTCPPCANRLPTSPRRRQAVGQPLWLSMVPRLPRRTQHLLLPIARLRSPGGSICAEPNPLWIRTPWSPAAPARRSSAAATFLFRHPWRPLRRRRLTPRRLPPRSSPCPRPGHPPPTPRRISPLEPSRRAEVHRPTSYPRASSPRRATDPVAPSRRRHCPLLHRLPQRRSTTVGRRRRRARTRSLQYGLRIRSTPTAPRPRPRSSL